MTLTYTFVFHSYGVGLDRAFHRWENQWGTGWSLLLNLHWLQFELEYAR
jgi:hypothetical protein